MACLHKKKGPVKNVHVGTGCTCDRNVQNLERADRRVAVDTDVCLRGHPDAVTLLICMVNNKLSAQG